MDGSRGYETEVSISIIPSVTEYRHYTEKADIYSFGILMFEVLTRSLPFEGISTWEIEKEVAQKKHRPAVPLYCPPGEKFLLLFLL